MLLHQERMLNSSSSSTPSSPSSSLLISSNHLPKPLINASSSAHTSISSNHHLQQPPPLHPTLLAPLPHYHHLHHLHAYPRANSTQHLHHLHVHPSVDSTHRLYSLPQASITTNCTINISNSGNDNERFSSHNHTVDPHCQAPISTNISKSVVNLVSESNGNHNYNVDPQCYTTDCSPRSVIRHVQSSSSAPSPDPSRPSCYYTNPSTNAGTSPSTTSPHEASNLFMTRAHNPTLHETSQGDFLLVHNQSVGAVDHHHLPPPWSLPTAMHHHHYGACTISKHSGHINYEAGAEESSKGGEMRNSPKLLERGGSRSADLHKQRGIGQFKSRYFSGSATEDNSCMIQSNGGVGYGSIEQPKQTGIALRTVRSNLNVNGNKCTAKPMYNSLPNSMQIDHHGHKFHMERSFSCDLHSSRYDARCSSACATLRQCTGGIKQEGSEFYNVNELAPKSPHALLDYVDGLASNDSYCNAKGCAQLGSKWEDAEKWVRPANDHYASGCKGFTNLGLLKMSHCINAGTAIKSHYIHYSNTHVPPAILSSDYPSNYSSDCTTTKCANYSSIRSFNNFNSATLSAQQENMINEPSLARQIVHVDCFNSHLTSSNPNLTYANPNSPSPQLATDQQIKEQLSKQRTGNNEPNYQHLQKNYTEKARQKHYASSGTGISEEAWDNYNVPLANQEIKASKKEASCGSGWNVLPQYLCTSHQLTDRFASGEVMPSATPRFAYARHNDENLLVRPNTQESVHISMVSLKEVGTQMSSVDGSGSISRFTSKSGSPQKPISPARHNTPAHMRSLNGSTKIINNIREVGKEAIDLEELVECHRAKLELQALSEGEHIHSFHRTTSNWSSREVEEADLSRSLRHSTELDDTKNHPWPSQSYSWKKDEESKLAKLQFKEAKIQAWEEKKKSKADAQLKRLEESLAKRRSQTTNRIMGSLGAAQKKAEEMRARVYAKQKRGTHDKFRHRSLSPLSRCTCFSPLQ